MLKRQLGMISYEKKHASNYNNKQYSKLYKLHNLPPYSFDVSRIILLYSASLASAPEPEPEPEPEPV